MNLTKYTLNLIKKINMIIYFVFIYNYDNHHIPTSVIGIADT